MFNLSKAAVLGILTGVVGLLVSLLPFGFELEENVGLDILFKLRGTRQPPSDVVVVSIDNASAVHLNLPDDLKKWPRSLHARLTDNLARAGAAVIAFDLMFDEARLATDDDAFAESMRRARNVVLFELLRRDTVSTPDQPGPPAGPVHSETLIPPIPAFAQAAVALAPFPLPKSPLKLASIGRLRLAPAICRRCRWSYSSSLHSRFTTHLSTQ